ncbi:MAG: hypothetical protein LBG84_09550 [Treponema sp.]|jgi:polyhydroxyalkanoate synthesis regulator phasin|nr:hypothetical protein [Treponema sp.]
MGLLPSIIVKRGEVIGIGKVKIPRTRDFDHEIQMLSFLVIKEPSGSFISTCIHLRIDGYGGTIREAQGDMVENISYFLAKNFESLSVEDAWDNLRDLFKTDEWSNELWDAYHEVQIQLSTQGRPTDNVEHLQQRLESLAERVRELESREARELEGEISALGENLIVDYTPVEKAA